MQSARDDFERHWDVASDLAQAKRAAAREFLAPLRALATSAHELRVLDGGCGDGVHAELLARESSRFKRLRLVGIDLSRRALARARRRAPGGYAASDLGRLPFADGSFDVVFCYGALAYTADPRAGFAELCRVLDKGGRLGIWMYPRARGLGVLLFSGVRGLCRRLGSRATRWIAHGIVPLLGLLPTKSRVSLANASWSQCLEVVLVNLAPAVLHFFEPQQVERWFEEEGLEILSADAGDPITIWAVRRS